MRKIVAGLFISLDGVIENANEWIGPWFSPELGQAVGSMIAAQDTMLLGRVTYDEFAAHWPHQTGEMADTMNSTAEVRRVRHAGDGGLAEHHRDPARPRRRRDRRAQAAARQEHRHDRQRRPWSAWLLREGLLDELHLLVFPVVLGSGKRLFDARGDKLPLKLIGSETFETGVVHLTYAKA